MREEPELAVEAETSPGQPPAGPSARHVMAERLLVGLLALLAGAIVAVAEAFFVVLRAGTVLVPVSLVLALVGHPLLVWSVWHVGRWRPAVLLPFLSWLLVVPWLAIKRPEGDLVIVGNNWVSTALLLLGPVTYAAAIGVLLVRSSSARRSRR